MSTKSTGSSNHKSTASFFNHGFRTAILLNELEQFTGSLERYCHPLNRRVIFTPGIKYLVEVARAGWLTDAIATHIASEEFERSFQRDHTVLAYTDRVIGQRRSR